MILLVLSNESLINYYNYSTLDLGETICDDVSEANIILLSLSNFFNT